MTTVASVTRLSMIAMVDQALEEAQVYGWLADALRAVAISAKEVAYGEWQADNRVGCPIRQVFGGIPRRGTGGFIARWDAKCRATFGHPQGIIWVED